MYQYGNNHGTGKDNRWIPQINVCNTGLQRKTTTLVTHPAEYRITVEYDGIEYVISGRDVYDKYSDKVGEYTNGTLETKTYDNGIIDYDIIELE